MPTTYYKLQSPSGKEIRYAVRMRCFLLVMTNYNALSHIDFGERLAESPQLASLENIGTYDDGTGYYIFRLKMKHNRETLQSEVQSTFEEYFK